MLKGVIFDWDGTLCDTLPVCVGAFRLTMQHYLGRNLSDAEIMEHFGVNEKGIIMLKMPGREAEWDAALEEYDRHYRELHAPLREPYPGIRELLEDLRKKGVKIALVTGKAEGSCAISLEMTNLQGAFDFLRTGSEFGLNKKDCIEDFIRETGIAREDVYYVGDAPSDVREAKAAGVHAVSVLWSSIVDEEGVRKEGPEVIFKTVEELKKYLNDQTAAKIMTEELANNEEKHLDFIRQKINNDLASGKFKRVVTRFPPEPNGYLHIGHAKALCLDFGLAQEYPDAECHLRFDDTNPSKEDDEYVEAIKEDIHWLGFDWGPHLYFASDYFEKMYEWALEMIRKGKAYVDDSTPEEIREMRGTLTEPGVESPYRNRSVEENLDLFQRMRAGEFPDGSKVLRAKIDMKSQNINFRDPVMYRIVRKEHHRQGSKWCIYPMYDWAHGLEDSIEGITNSLCSLEFENHRPLYNWFLDQLDNIHHPEQTEFARLNLTGTVMSKRKLRTLVDNGYVSGWDDPRMPTLSGMRRRGYPPAAIREFIKRVGIAKVDSVVDFALLEHCVRDELNRTAQRLMVVQDPLKVVLTNYPEGQTETLTAINNPEDESAGTREVPFGRELYIERDDFMEDPPNKFFRLAPGREVRLRYAYFITCQEVIKDENGNITELRCTYDPATRGGESPDGRKVKGTIHWVAAHTAVKVTLNNFSALFKVDDPENVPEGQDFTVNVAEDSLTVNDKALAEPAAAETKPLEPLQFERIGYFTPDRTSTKEAPVFNRTATLKDSWGKIQKKQ